MKQKIRLVLVPFVTIAIAFIVGYTFLNWLLIVKLAVINPKEELVDLWLPLTLPIIPIWIWLRPRLKLLTLERKGKDTAFGYYMIALLAIGAPSIIAQMYMQTASGKLTALNTVRDISSQPTTMYYTIRRHYIDKENAGISYTSDVGGKYNRDLNLHIYIACPIYDTDQEPTKVDPKEEEVIDTTATTGKKLIMLDGMQVDSTALTNLSPASVASMSVLKGNAATAIYGTAGANGVIIITTKEGAKERIAPPIALETEVPKAWLCTQYGKRISNSLSNDEKETRYHHFYDECMKKFEEENAEAFVYLRRTGNNTAHAGYMGAVEKTNLLQKNQPALLLEPVFTPFAARNGSKLMWVFIAFGVGVLVFFLLLIKPAFKEAGTTAAVAVPVEPATPGKGLKMLLPQKAFFITPLLAYANIFIFLLMVFAGLGFMSFDAKDLLDWGAGFGPYTENGQWWRLLTMMFLHGGFMHLLGNMYGLFFAGIFLEPVLGRKRYLICYLATGIAASVVSLWWHSNIVSVGASGAIFGLFGILLVLLLTKSLPALNKGFLVNILVFVGYNLLIGMSAGIDNAAHVGGLAAGIIAGLFIYPGIKADLENPYDLTMHGS